MDTLYQCIADISPNDTVFIDKNTEPTQKYYYYINGTTWTGEKSSSSIRIFCITDNKTTPSKPSPPTVESIKNGVKISWEITDPFIRGYYIYRANGIGDTAMQISNLLLKQDSITSYIDSSNSIEGNKVYAYSIVAESKSYVKSLPSDQILVRPGKKIMLLPPNEISIVKSKNGIKLIWQDMTIIQEGISGYNIYRRVYNSGKEFVKINSELVSYETNFFIDSLIQTDTYYEYTTSCFDFYGNTSNYGASAVGFKNKTNLASPVNIRLFPENGFINIEWDEVFSETMIGYRIYRESNEQKPIIIKDVDKTITEFKDNTFEKGKQYRYWVVSLYKGNLESGKEAEAFYNGQ